MDANSKREMEQEEQGMMSRRHFLSGAAWQKAWPACPNGGGVKAGPMDGTMPFTGYIANREGKR